MLSPLKMTNTLAYEKGKNEVPHRAYGHSKIDGDAGAKPIRARLRPCWATAAFILRSTTWPNGTAPCAITRCSAKRKCGPH